MYAIKPGATGDITLAAFAKQAVPPKTKPKAKDFVSPKVWGEKD